LNQNDKRKMMKGLYLVPLAAATLLLGACATTVKPTYVSPTQYQSLSCQQLQSEYNRIQQYIDNGVQTPKSTGMGVGLEEVGDLVHPSLSTWGNLLQPRTLNFHV